MNREDQIYEEIFNGIDEDAETAAKAKVRLNDPNHEAYLGGARMEAALILDDAKAEKSQLEDWLKTVMDSTDIPTGMDYEDYLSSEIESTKLIIEEQEEALTKVNRNLRRAKSDADFEEAKAANKVSRDELNKTKADLEALENIVKLIADIENADEKIKELEAKSNDAMPLDLAHNAEGCRLFMEDFGIVYSADEKKALKEAIQTARENGVPYYAHLHNLSDPFANLRKEDEIQVLDTTEAHNISDADIENVLLKNGIGYEESFTDEELGFDVEIPATAGFQEPTTPKMPAVGPMGGIIPPVTGYTGAPPINTTLPHITPNASVANTQPIFQPAPTASGFIPNPDPYQSFQNPAGPVQDRDDEAVPVPFKNTSVNPTAFQKMRQGLSRNTKTILVGCATLLLGLAVVFGLSSCSNNAKDKVVDLPAPIPQEETFQGFGDLKDGLTLVDPNSIEVAPDRIPGSDGLGGGLLAGGGFGPGGGTGTGVGGVGGTTASAPENMPRPADRRPGDPNVPQDDTGYDGTWTDGGSVPPPGPGPHPGYGDYDPPSQGQPGGNNPGEQEGGGAADDNTHDDRDSAEDALGTPEQGTYPDRESAENSPPGSSTSSPPNQQDNKIEFGEPEIEIESNMVTYTPQTHTNDITYDEAYDWIEEAGLGQSR